MLGPSLRVKRKGEYEPTHEEKKRVPPPPPHMGHEVSYEQKQVNIVGVAHDL